MQLNYKRKESNHPNYRLREVKKLVLNLEKLGIGEQAIKKIRLYFYTLQNNQIEKIASYNDIEMEKQEYYCMRIKYFENIKKIYNNIDTIIISINILQNKIINNENLNHINTIKKLNGNKDEILLFILKSGIEIDNLLNEVRLLANLDNKSNYKKNGIDIFVDSFNNKNLYDVEESTPKGP